MVALLARSEPDPSLNDYLAAADIARHSGKEEVGKLIENILKGWAEKKKILVHIDTSASSQIEGRRSGSL